MNWIKVRLDRPGGVFLPKQTLESVYLSTMDFEPQKQRLRVLHDGVVEIVAEGVPYMVYAKVTLSGYGTIWVVADNLDEGYTGDFVDFISEAAKSYIDTAGKYAQEVDLTPGARGYLLAARKFEHLANRGQSTGENRLYSLSHAMYAAEAALLERSRQRLSLNPREDIKLGCNFFVSHPPMPDMPSSLQLFLTSLPCLFILTAQSSQRDVMNMPTSTGRWTFWSLKASCPKAPLWFGHKDVNPPWLFGQDYTALRRNTQTISAHHATQYKGRIDIWNAMNEAHDWANCFEINHEQLTDLTRAAITA